MSFLDLITFQLLNKNKSTSDRSCSEAKPRILCSSEC